MAWFGPKGVATMAFSLLVLFSVGVVAAEVERRARRRLDRAPLDARGWAAMPRHDNYPRTEIGERQAWRAWLAEHHASAPGAWLVSFKKATGKPAIAYGDAVEEALCFGWVDSLPRKLDAERSMLLFTPRRPGSRWSRPNKERVARMVAAGRMTPAGAALVEAAKADGAWTALDDVENLVVPDDLAAALAQHAGAAQKWDGFPRSVRRGILEWILDAKRPATRSKRISETAERAAAGERANQWR